MKGKDPLKPTSGHRNLGCIVLFGMIPNPKRRLADEEANASNWSRAGGALSRDWLGVSVSVFSLDLIRQILRAFAWPVGLAS